MKILVIGDIMLDEYIYGSITRLSPEAPITLFDQVSKVYELGGAAKVAEILSRSTDFDIFLAGVLGGDNEGRIVKNALSKIRNLSYAQIKDFPKINTTKKTRYYLGTNQVFRADNESPGYFRPDFYFNRLEYLKQNIKTYNAIIVSDYEKGVMHPNFIYELVDICVSNNIPIFVDPKDKNIHMYVNSTLIKMNNKELDNLIGASFKLSTVEMKLKKAMEILMCRHLVVTFGKDAVSIISKNGETETEYTTSISYVDPTEIEGVNYVGSGDAFICGLVISYLNKKDIITCTKDACEFTYKYLEERKNV